MGVGAGGSIGVGVGKDTVDRGACVARAGGRRAGTACTGRLVLAEHGLHFADAGLEGLQLGGLRVDLLLPAEEKLQVSWRIKIYRGPQK